jgi:pimeloyl-ACP methyl ester carboxylesterase
MSYKSKLRVKCSPYILGLRPYNRLDSRTPTIAFDHGLFAANMNVNQSSSIDTSRWQQRIATITTTSEEQVRLNFIECPPATSSGTKGVILLIHGFPQTSYQFRHVITPISDAGYRVIAPDYRGAGQSSKPLTGYEKTQMAEDLHILMQSHLGVRDKIHVVGHDIGGMIAFAYASRYPDDVASVIWGECPLPGSSCYEKIKGTPDVFHFVFHQVPDLPEALIAGKEREYCKHFFDKIIYNSGAITPADLDHYALAYSQPGAIRAGLEVYRAFEKDAEENREWIERYGKLKIPSLLMMGAEFMLAQSAASMASEFHEGAETLTVEESAHYIAEENPEAFVQGVLNFVGRH